MYVYIIMSSGTAEEAGAAGVEADKDQEASEVPEFAPLLCHFPLRRRQGGECMYTVYCVALPCLFV